MPETLTRTPIFWVAPPQVFPDQRQGWSRGFELGSDPEIFKASYTDFFRYKLLFSRAGPKFKSISDENLVVLWSSPKKLLAGLRSAQNEVILIGERSEPKKF